MLCLEHLRSLKLSPLSSGITFTNAVIQWYVWGSYPQRTLSADEAVRNAWSQKRIAPFLGLGTGLATGDATDTTNGRDTVISGYAFGLTLRAGADYPLSERLSLRSLIELDTIIMGTSIRSRAFQLGAVWYL